MSSGRRNTRAIVAQPLLRLRECSDSRAPCKDHAAGASLGLALLLLGCGGGSDSGEVDSYCREPALSYANFGEGFMDKHCNGCHSSYLPEGERGGAPVGVDLDSYPGVRTWLDRVEARGTGDAPTMPPGGGPEESEVRQLEEWLSCSVWDDATRMDYQ